MKRRLLVCLMLFTLCFTANPALAAASTENEANSIARAVNYLYSVQNPDGGFPYSLGDSSSTAVTAWVVMGLSAAGKDVQAPLHFMNNDRPESTCDFARAVLAYSAGAKQDSAGVLLDQISSWQQASGQFAISGEEDGFINSHMWSVLAFASAGKEIPSREKARQWLLDRQNSDGGYGWYEFTSSDADDTAIAIQVLVLLGEDPESSPVIEKCLKFIKTCQQPDGGFSSGELAGNKSNASSDAWVIQGLLAAGQNPESAAWSVNGNNAVSHLLSLQNADGSFSWMPGVNSSSVLSTAYALMALNQTPFPVNLSVNKPAYGNRFYDLPASHWAYPYISKLVAQGVIAGYPDRTFRPEKSVNRAEFAKLLVTVLGLEKGSGHTAEFQDVPTNHWAYDYIATANACGIITGYGDGRFGPNDPITREQMAVMVVKAVGLPGSGILNFNDIDMISPWAKEAVATAGSKQIIRGFPDGTFQPQASATRAQAVIVLSNVIQQKGSN